METLSMIPVSGPWSEVADVPLDPAPYLQRIRELCAHYEIEDPHIKWEERMLIRNRSIRAVFDLMVARRRQNYESHIRTLVQPCSCKCSHSDHKTCPGNIAFSNDYVVVENSIGWSGPFHQNPYRTSPTQVGWLMRTASYVEGKVWASGQYSNLVISDKVEGDRAAVRAVLAVEHLPDDRAINPLVAPEPG